MIEELCQLEDYFGNGIDQPLIHVQSLIVSSESIDTGKEGSKFSFMDNDIEYILFKPSPEKMEELVDWSESFCYDIVGRPNINEFDGKRVVQIIIEAIERRPLEGIENTEFNDEDWDKIDDEDDSEHGKKTEVIEDDFEW
jgi:single-stranded-DNA-specific exonuclease